MGKLAELKQAIADKLTANVTELADITVIPHRGRDIQQQVTMSLQKTQGLAVIVALVKGEDASPERVRGMEIRLDHTVSITVWTIPTQLTAAAVSAPLTSGSREPDDVVEAIIKYLHNLDVLDVGALLEGGPGTLRVTGWTLINAEPPHVVYEITAEIITQL